MVYSIDTWSLKKKEKKNTLGAPVSHAYEWLRPDAVTIALSACTKEKSHPTRQSRDENFPYSHVFFLDLERVTNDGRREVEDGI